MNKEEVRKAFDSFENDDFVGSREILKKEIGNTVNTYLKDKLGLKGNTEEDKEE